MWYQNTHQFCVFEYHRKLNLNNLTFPPSITTADIISPNLRDKFQPLELLIDRKFIDPRGGENIIIIIRSYNAEYIWVQLVAYTERPDLKSVLIFGTEIRNGNQDALIRILSGRCIRNGIASSEIFIGKGYGIWSRRSWAVW